MDRVVDAVMFKGEENGVPFVRFPDGSASWFYGVPTPGASNQLAETDVQISEVMYHPAPTLDNPENNENDEYVELYNPTTHAVTLMNLVQDVGVWRLAGGIDYLFPTNTVMPAKGRLVVVPFDPAADPVALSSFLSAYGLTNGQIRLLGPYSGQLNNKTDSVRLERPVNPDVADEAVSWHGVDQITYYDAAPWPTGTEGTGRPLARVPGRTSGDTAASWVAGFAATPGCGPAKVAVTEPAAETGYQVPASITVAAAVDMAFVVGTVRQVVFSIDGVDAASVSVAPYTAVVGLDAHEGERWITARLVDDEDATVSAAVPVVAYTNVPAFTAGMSQTINLTVSDRVGLHAAADVQSGMTNAVQWAWSCPGNSSVVFENPSKADAVAHFTQPGQYSLMATMAYGQFVTNRFVIVTVTGTNTVNRVPYKENFETYELGSSLVGIEGWYGVGAEVALIGTNMFSAVPPGGYPLSGAHERSISFFGGVTNIFEQASLLTNVCMDMLVAFTPGGDDPPELPPETQLAFWINSERQRVVMWHGLSGSTNRWTELTDVAIGTNASVRLTVMADYSRNVQGSFGFRIWINRQAVTNPAVWFATASTNSSCLSSLSLLGMGQVDDLVVDTYNSMLYRRITAAAGAHGRVSPSGEVLVPVGTSTNIVVLPDLYYRVGAVTVDGLAAGPVPNVTFTNVWDEHALSADFLTKLTASGVPELWLNRMNPAWTNRFDEHALADSDGDGVPNEQEYVAGTDAVNSQSVFRLDVGGSNGASVVSFTTVASDGFYGPGFRYYALEQADVLAPSNWQGVAGLTHVVGSGQSIIYTNRIEDAPHRFFRGRVWLGP
jgi:hypothetical protein